MTHPDHYKSKLSREQVISLSEFITEMYGSGLSKSELIETILVVLEDIPGLELMSNQSEQCQINQIKEKYYDRR